MNTDDVSGPTEMKSVERNKLMLLWTIVTTAPVALFWVYCWIFSTGSIPDTNIRITGWTIYDYLFCYMPFDVSRAFDILAGPVCACSFIALSYCGFKDDPGDGVFLGLMAGCVCFIFGVIFPNTVHLWIVACMILTALGAYYSFPSAVIVFLLFFCGFFGVTFGILPGLRLFAVCELLLFSTPYFIWIARRLTDPDWPLFTGRNA